MFRPPENNPWPCGNQPLPGKKNVYSPTGCKCLPFKVKVAPFRNVCLVWNGASDLCHTFKKKKTLQLAVENGSVGVLRANYGWRKQSPSSVRGFQCSTVFVTSFTWWQPAKVFFKIFWQILVKYLFWELNLGKCDIVCWKMKHGSATNCISNSLSSNRLHVNMPSLSLNWRHVYSLVWKMNSLICGQRSEMLLYTGTMPNTKRSW